MLLHLPHLLNPDELACVQHTLAQPQAWQDGRSSAGGQAADCKRNRQLDPHSAASQRLQPLVLQALRRDALFFSAALPRRILPPRFNRYSDTHNHYGPHIDAAVMAMPGGRPLRTDLSCTVFLSDPESYSGGELVVHSAGAGNPRIKLAAGDALVYDASHVHEVSPVTRGERLAAFFWIESMVRSPEQRRVLWEMDMNLLKLRAQHGESAETTALTGVYHNLLRQWAST